MAFPLERKIHALWLQGRENAPPIAELVFQRWEALNPGWTLIVHSEEDVQTAGFLDGLRLDHATPQALSDLIRVHLLAQEGGVWVDATVFPILPLDAWLPPLQSRTGFFGLEGFRLPLEIVSWFLASSSGHPMMTAWRDVCRDYWSCPRQPQRGAKGLPGMLGARSLVTTGRSDGPTSADPEPYPYFWFHFLFTELLEQSAALEGIWADTPALSGNDAHSLKVLVLNGYPPTERQLLIAARRSPLQKLDYNANPLAAAQLLNAMDPELLAKDVRIVPLRAP